MTSTRYDLAALEFDAARDALRARLSTALGRHLVDQLEPCTSAAAANLHARQASELAERLSSADRPPMGGVVEVRSWLLAFFAGEHQPLGREIAELKRLLRAAAHCRRWIEVRTEHLALGDLARTIPALGDLVAELESIVDDRGEVLDSASPRLAEARAVIQIAEDGVRVAVAQLVADPELRRCLQSSEPTWRNGRPVFAVRQELRGRIAGVLHDRSQSGATLFIEPAAVVEAANRLADARAAEHREIQVVLTHVCRGLRRCQSDIEAAVAAMRSLDLVLACARLIAEDGWICAPVVEAGARLLLCGAVHPILLATARRRDELVELDVELGASYRMLVVTGPNTGGKTVVLKTIGLLSLMALCGMPVPARVGTQVPCFDGVFVDIGDAQGISQNLSTFSSHVTRIVRCLGAATAQSLVLFDELGAGTDPEEGGALGHAVLEELERRRALTVITTHVGRLKSFALDHRGAENGSMAFDGESLRPLFRLEVGIPGTSHALDIAGRLGVAPKLIERARELMGVRDSRLEDELQRVQSARREAELERQRRHVLSLEVEQAGNRLADERRGVERERAWVQEEADAVVDEQLHAVRSLLEGPLRELANGPRSFGETARQLLARLDRLFEGTSVHRRRMRFLRSIKRDSTVYLPRLGKRCKVHKVDRTREMVSVEVGKLRLEVPFEDVSWLQPLD